MTKPLHRCPAGHEEKLPYHGEALSWCDRCGGMVWFVPVLALPERVVAMPPRHVTRTAKPNTFQTSWKQHKPRTPYRE